MADQIDEDDRATQELILRMIAQDLSAESQLQYSDSEWEERNEDSQGAQDDSESDADATVGPDSKHLHQESNQTLSQIEDASSPISVGTSVSIHLTDRTSFDSTGSHLPVLQDSQHINIPTTDNLSFDSAQHHPQRTTALQRGGSGAITTNKETSGSDNDASRKLTDLSKETPVSIDKAQANSADKLISSQQGLDTSSNWDLEDAQQSGQSTTVVHDWQSDNTSNRTYLEPAVEPPSFSTFEQAFASTSSSWWSALTSLATTSAMASSQNNHSQPIGRTPEKPHTSTTSAPGFTDQDGGTALGKRRMDDEVTRSQPSAGNDHKRSKQTSSLSASSNSHTHSVPASGYGPQVAARLARPPVADQEAYAGPVVSPGILRAHPTSSHAYEEAAIPDRTLPVQRPQDENSNDNYSALRGNPFMGEHRATASHAAIPEVGRQSSNTSTFASWPDYPPALSNQQQWGSPYSSVPEAGRQSTNLLTNLRSFPDYPPVISNERHYASPSESLSELAARFNQPLSDGREPPMDRPRRNIVQPSPNGTESYTGRSRRDAIYIHRLNGSGPLTTRKVNISDYSGSDLTSLGDSYDGMDSEENQPQVLHEGVLHTRITIPWPGKPGWVERDVDESFGRDYEDGDHGRQGRGGRYISRIERMEMERRRREEATATEIHIGEHETLDSIIMEMVAKERKEKKGKGKADAQGEQAGLW